MDATLILSNILTAPILFFLLGMLATFVRSDLRVPEEVGKFLSLYLLLAIGLKGGVELAKNGVDAQVAAVLIAAVIGAAVIPLGAFFVLRLRLDVANAAAISATYGSISAVTFVTATDFLQAIGEPHSGYMVAAMALMESPAIVVGVLLARMLMPAEAGANGDDTAKQPSDWGELAREAFLNGAVLVLVGSLIIGAVVGPEGFEGLKAFAAYPFKGVLCVFLLEMGLLAAKRVGDLKRGGPFLLSFAVLSPIVQAAIGIAVARAIGTSPGDALLLAILFGSASYIAVPAAMRLSIPQANPSLYVPMSLALTFPFNIALGIPLYMSVIRFLWPEQGP
jgi:hypothetical protein